MRRKIGYLEFLSILSLLFFHVIGQIRPASAYQHWTEMVPMTDGTRLATDVYIPDEEEGPWPTMLIRTVYGKSGCQDQAYVTEYGYSLVVQDCRGRFDSEGIDGIFFDDGWSGNRDGYDTVEWVAAQEWAEGRIATLGGSALGITQIMMAGAVPPHLTCQWIQVAATDLYSQAMFQGGSFRKAMVEGWLKGQGSSFKLPEIEAHPDYGPYWHPVNAERREPFIQAPGVHIGGWYDIFTQGTINAFTGRQYNGGDGARGNQMLLIGPWTHGGFSSLAQGELTYPEGSRFNDEFSEYFGEWVEYWLKDENTGIMDRPPVHFYVMGDVDDPDAPGNEWRTSENWPADARIYPLYLHGDGSLDWLYPSSNEPARTFVYDPENPVPTLGGANLILPAGPYDQRSIETRQDVLIYETEILEESVEIVGPLICRLYLSSDCPDTDLTAKLTDVYPDGRSMLVLDGILRVRRRIGMDREDFLTPGEIVECQIDLWSTAIAFNAGHRIRLAVSSSNHPRFDPNPNTGKPFRFDDETRIAENTIHSDAEHPSCLMLPVTNLYFTPTPTVIPTPYPQPTNTPVVELGVRLELAASRISPQEEFWVRGHLNNPGPEPLNHVPLFFLLEVFEAYYFWPSWACWNPPYSGDIDYMNVNVPVGSRSIYAVSPFTWPDTGDDSMNGLLFFGAMLNEEMSQILGESDSAEWGYGP